MNIEKTKEVKDLTVSKSIIDMSSFVEFANF